MQTIYQNYISAITQPVKNQCRQLSEQMKMVFPELELVCGFYHDPLYGKRPHWWLLDGDEIIDPTYSQFTPHGDYEQIEQPTTKCLNCGEFTRRVYFCSTKCEMEMAESLVG